MIKLREARITDGVPKIVAAQPWVQVLSEVYAELQGRVLDCLDAGVTFSEVDSCSEETLDQMAIYLKVEWYDSAADLETKRRIIKTAIEIQRYAGTVKAVREQVSVTYPDSEVEEWFDYGGTPGFWRLNVNITDAPAQYHTIDEMEDLLGYTKRLTAHLEHISYMVRHGISIGAQVECMAYKVPICGATICGTYWRPSTLGWSSNGLLNVGGQAEAFWTARRSRVQSPDQHKGMERRTNAGCYAADGRLQNPPGGIRRRHGNWREAAGGHAGRKFRRYGIERRKGGGVQGKAPRLRQSKV